jgi:hypothetical protein
MIYQENGKPVAVAKEQRFKLHSMGLQGFVLAAKVQDMRRRRNNGMGFSNVLSHL